MGPLSTEDDPLGGDISTYGSDVTGQTPGATQAAQPNAYMKLLQRLRQSGITTGGAAQRGGPQGGQRPWSPVDTYSSLGQIGGAIAHLFYKDGGKVQGPAPGIVGEAGPEQIDHSDGSSEYVADPQLRMLGQSGTDTITPLTPPPHHVTPAGRILIKRLGAQHHRFQDGGEVQGDTDAFTAADLSDAGSDAPADLLSPEALSPGISTYPANLPATPPTSVRDQLAALKMPVPKKPGMLQRLGAGALGAAAGYVNASGKRMHPIDASGAEQAIEYPGYPQQVQQYQAQRADLTNQLAQQQGATADQLQQAQVQHTQAQTQLAQAQTVDWSSRRQSKADIQAEKDKETQRRVFAAIAGKHTPEYINPGQPIPPGFTSIINPDVPNMVAVVPSSVRPAPKELVDSGWMPGRKAGDLVPSEELAEAQKMYSQAKLEDVKAGNKPEKTPAENQWIVDSNDPDPKISGPAKANLQALANQKRASEKPTPEPGSWQLTEDSQGKPILFNSKTAETKAAPGIQKPGTFAKAQAPNDSLQFAKDYLQRGSYSGPGDEALMEKFFDLAKPSSGFRMSKPQQDMLRQARSWKDSAEAFGRHAVSGTWFSDKQRQQIVSAMDQIVSSKTPPGANSSTGIIPKPGETFQGHKVLKVEKVQ